MPTWKQQQARWAISAKVALKTQPGYQRKPRDLSELDLIGICMPQVCGMRYKPKTTKLDAFLPYYLPWGTLYVHHKHRGPCFQAESRSTDSMQLVQCQFAAIAGIIIHCCLHEQRSVRYRHLVWYVPFQWVTTATPTIGQLYVVLLLTWELRYI